MVGSESGANNVNTCQINSHSTFKVTSINLLLHSDARFDFLPHDWLIICINEQLNRCTEWPVSVYYQTVCTVCVFISSLVCVLTKGILHQRKGHKKLNFLPKKEHKDYIFSNHNTERILAC